MLYYIWNQECFFLKKMTLSYLLKFQNKNRKSTDTFNNIFYLKLIKEAHEIHVINSSIFCLADRVATSGKLYVHNIYKQKTFREYMTLFKNWEVVNY